jgi:hypothetical protein
MQGAPPAGATAPEESGWHLPCTPVLAEGDPMDFLFVAATVAFFAASLAYVRGCDRL